MPSELYRYADCEDAGYTVKVNGKRMRAALKDGYFPVKREWKAGDKVELELDMPVRSSVADPRVEADVNRLCITRGPLLYCAESPDNEYKASAYIISDPDIDARMNVFGEGVMKGIRYLEMEASALAEDGVHDTHMVLIPYYAWNNRGDNTTMNVWFARDEQTAQAGLQVLAPNVADVSASYTYSNDDVMAIADGRKPSSSFDKSIPRWTSWRHLGEAQQVTITLKKAQKIDNVSVYWYEDDGGVRVPASWTMEYRSEGKWLPFVPYTTDHFGVEKDQFNMVHPESEISADAIRLNITPKENYVVGILEVVVE
jgi:hypothetical protein